MVSAWYMDDVQGDQRAPHQCVPNEPVSVDVLQDLGMLCFHVDADTYVQSRALERICAERGYKNRDELQCCPAKLPNYDDKIKTFFTEHLHEDEEIRFVLAGSGYFDVRDRKDRWIRVKVGKSDLLVLVSGNAHM